MGDPHETPLDPHEAGLSQAPDAISVLAWAGDMPQIGGVPPRVRLRRRWIAVAWLLPVAVVVGIAGVAIARELRAVPAVQSFILRYPGTDNREAVFSGFPWWLRWQHVLNLFMMLFIIRAGLQILADHPRLYWNRHSTPGTEWFRFQKPVPRDRLWTAKDDSVRLPSWLGLPGIRHSIGLARWWHFTFDLLWLANGVIFYVLLFVTPQWRRIVPLSWTVFPNALSTMVQYLSLDWPQDRGFIVYNGLQLLAYFLTVFVAAPLALVTGLLQSPSVSNRFRIAGRAINRQTARSIHFFILLWMVVFILAHTVMVWTTGLRVNLNHIMVGINKVSWTGTLLYAIMMAVVIAVWLWASPFTLRWPRLVQRTGRFILTPFQKLLEQADPRPGEYSDKDISLFFWPNGTLPVSEEYKALAEGGFEDFKLSITGLVGEPAELTLAQLRALESQEQITQHFCIQGWSGVARWGGVPMRAICELVKPLPEAKWVVFYSFGEGSDGGTYYDAHQIAQMYHRLTILAYDMNNAPLGFVHGAPLRLRNEVELGFKMVKWVCAVEFVADFQGLGTGEGGYNEDHEFYGYRMSI